MKNQKKIHSLLCILILVSFLPACGGSAAVSSAAETKVSSASIAGIIDKYRQEIPERMQEQNVPGLAIAVVDDQNILWAEGFGYTDWDRQTPVTPNTLFSIQSMSKSFTATAVMFAAQDGLVNLDAPITTYLPNFTVHSIFEEHPEQKMTLRILLSHTAGFPHDVAYGSNNDNSPFSVEKHNASIADTWLMFPVGTRYSYSNIGIDLAGYILSERSGMPFIQYVQQKVLDPLGMKDSTLDYRRVRATPTRAIGHLEIPLRPPVDFQLIPSGGVWTSAEDLAHYVQFHINQGALDGARLLKEDLAETMYTPPNLPALGAYGGSGYALGVVDSSRNGARIIYHGGGGFGFNTQMAWYPELKLGALVLTNSHQQDGYSFTLCQDVLDHIIAGDIPLYRERFISATHVTPAYPPDKKGAVLTDNALRDLIKSKALADDAAAQRRRSPYTGTYIVTAWGIPIDTFEIHDANGEIAWTYLGDESLYTKNSTLTEAEPGLFFSENGNILDLRGPVPMIDNIRLIKANPQILPLKIALFAICGLFFLSALLFWPLRALISRVRRKKASADGPAEAGSPAAAAPGSRRLIWTGILAVMASLFSLLCLVIVALIPNLIYVPWPRPYADLAWWQFAIMSLPFISLLLAVVIALLSILAIRNRALARAAHIYYFIAALALIAFNWLLLL